ncbi:MAG TPA: hypothetical protein DDW50_03455 [Firmicutes bacterium]|jgi:hypothetical protein|nr:hypothetical protein [Bacillota bacterium]
MDEQTALKGLILRRFFSCFHSVDYHGASIGKYYYNQFLYHVLGQWDLTHAKENLPYWHEINEMKDSDVYQWIDEPYPYDPHPGGLILMRGGFGDIASLYLPKERFILLSPNQAEVDLIKLNRPDLTAHNIENYYRENPTAVEALNQQIAAIIQNQKDDPLFGSTELLEWFKKQTPEIVRVFDAVQELFHNFHIGAVLTISSIVWMDSALNLIARANRIPSLTLQHGLIFDRDLFCHTPINATKKMVWGNANREWYQKYGFPESRTSVIGSPRFDTIFNRKWCGKEKLHQILGIEPAQKIMVYATGTEMSTIVPIILNGLAAIPDLFLILSLHPSETPIISQYQQLTAGYFNCKVVRFGQISLYDSLSGADFFVTHCSTAALEAMLFKLPVITVEPSSSTCFSYGDLGASIRVSNSDELNQVVSRLIGDATYRANAVTQYQKFLSHYCIPDGTASKRLFEQVEHVCNTGGSA